MHGGHPCRRTRNRRTAAARPHPQLRRPLRERHVPGLCAPRSASGRRIPRRREPARRHRDGDVVQHDVRRRSAPAGRRGRRRTEQAGWLQRADRPPEALGRGPEPRRAGQRQEGEAAPEAHTGCRPARRPAVGHGDDPRHPGGLVQGRAGRQARARRRARHGHRRHPSGHRAQLQRGAEPQLHRRHPADRRAVRGRAGRLLQRSGERRRGRSRHARRRDDRLAAERHRDGGSRAERHAREPARRPGLGLLLPAAVGRRAHLRRRPRDRRRQHELLHRPVALQLLEQPSRFPGLTDRAEDDHRGDDPRAQLRAQQGRHADRGGRERAHGHGPSDGRRDQPGLSAGLRVHPDRQQLVPDDADGRPERRQRRRGRSQHDQGRLLELGCRGSRRHRSRRLLPRSLRDACASDRRDADPGAVSAQASRSRTATSTRTVCRPRSSSSGTAAATPAPTTSTSRARRWHRRTRSASRR